MSRRSADVPQLARALGAFVIAALLAACGSPVPASPAPASVAPSSVLSAGATPPPSTAPASPTVAPSEGASASTSTSGLPRTGRIEVTSAGYAVTLPANWFRIDFSKEDVEAFSKAGSGNLGPGVSDQLAAQVASLAAANISLYAFRFADADAVIGTNLNIIVLPSLGLDLATLETLNVQQLQQLVGKDVKIAHTRVTLPAGEALRLSYSIPAGGQPVQLIQHLVIGGDKQLIMTCTAPGSISKIADECDGMARSLEFLK